jgi:hypothetical protein
MARYVNPLSRRQVLKFGADTSVGGVLTPGISLAQAVVTDTKGVSARDFDLEAGGTRIAAYEARPEAPGRYRSSSSSRASGATTTSTRTWCAASLTPGTTRSRRSSSTARAR